MGNEKFAIGDIVTTTKQFGNIFGNIIPKGEPVRIIDMTQNDYRICDWRGVVILDSDWDGIKQGA